MVITNESFEQGVMLKVANIMTAQNFEVTSDK